MGGAGGNPAKYLKCYRLLPIREMVTFWQGYQKWYLPTSEASEAFRAAFHDLEGEEAEHLPIITT